MSLQCRFHHRKCNTENKHLLMQQSSRSKNLKLFEIIIKAIVSEMTFQKKSVKMTALDDLLADILKAVIVKIIVDILFKYAKKGLSWVIPSLKECRFCIFLVIHVFAMKLHIESSSTFIVSFVTFAYKSTTKEQKVAIRQKMLNTLSQNP